MCRLRFYWDCCIHFVLAKSRHGTHSPFVYRLVDEVIYARQRMGEPKNKVKRLIARLAYRFSAQHVYEFGAGLPCGPLDFVVAEAKNPELLSHQLWQYWHALHHGSVLIVLDIYRDERMKRLWQAIKRKPEVTVTVDLFHAGLVFFHPGQAKEDFKIRYY
ncbi:hypothetical protein ACFOET_13720 [Parapedobacter deserti]|uniref:Class I SAM-dependent methyltransferase n=1 Tax=Parapedobacter deserti TaxID=1912957 RepID=A0ABV7JKQ6_9SPHI